MKKIVHTLCLLSLMILGFIAKATKKKILFIGNSYTYVNDLPNTLKSLALSLGDSLEVDSNTPGGYTFNMHCTDATTLAKIQAGGWDYVVLQAQSQEPSFDPMQVVTDTYPYGKKLDSLIHVSSPCAETVFYMTWGRKNGDASNCASYPPICTYSGMQQRLRESYLEMCDSNHATCIPVGVAWKHFRDTYPSIELYQTDESHPVVNGTYLIACTFYASLFHKSCVGATYSLAGVTSADASLIQTIASNTVLDSIENWQHAGHLPKAFFTKTSSGMNASFASQSLRFDNLNWDFGDGTFLANQVNPMHTYTQAGTYIATLKASTTCGFIDLYKDTIHINSSPNSIEETSVTNPILVSYLDQSVRIEHAAEADKFILVASNGSIVKEVKIQNASTNVELNNASKGLYFYTVLKNNKVLQKGKLNIQ